MINNDPVGTVEMIFRIGTAQPAVRRAADGVPFLPASAEVEMVDERVSKAIFAY